MAKNMKNDVSKGTRSKAKKPRRSKADQEKAREATRKQQLEYARYARIQQPAAQHPFSSDNDDDDDDDEAEVPSKVKERRILTPLQYTINTIPVILRLSSLASKKKAVFSNFWSIPSVELECDAENTNIVETVDAAIAASEGTNGFVRTTNSEACSFYVHSEDFAQTI
jgi:hypothetical protein